jgi:hypothetical protein
VLTPGGQVCDRTLWDLEGLEAWAEGRLGHLSSASAPHSSMFVVPTATWSPLLIRFFFLRQQQLQQPPEMASALSKSKGPPSIKPPYKYLVLPGNESSLILEVRIIIDFQSVQTFRVVNPAFKVHFMLTLKGIGIETLVATGFEH